MSTATANELSWNGAYLGLHSAYGWGQVEASPAAIDKLSTQGGLVGAQVGYNANFGGFVLGIEGDVSWSGLHGDFLLNPGETMRSSVDYITTVRARAGVATDALLVYATGGVAIAGQSVSNVESGYVSSNTHTGWVVGGGIEAMVSENISLKAEYLYHAFDSQTYVYDGPFGASINPQTVRLGVNFHF